MSGLQREVILHLSLIKGVGPRLVQELADKMKACDQPINLYTMSASDMVHSFSLTSKQASGIAQGLQDSVLLEKELALLEKHRISWVTYTDDAYPELLRHIHRPPLVIYWQGSAVWQQGDGVAFVGSRKANAHARRLLDTIIPDLVARGIHTVSGGALGADTMAHQATLRSGGTTIAVLGSGLLCPYPAANKSLFTSISSSGGAVISMFPLTTPPSPGNFPARNYIISGLSKVCTVVQAAQKSGALITAYAALEQGREVCAVPGLFDDPLSAGCHQLIRQGAQVVTTAEDILSCLGMYSADTQLSQQATVEPKDVAESCHKREAKHGLSVDEQAIYTVCSRPSSIDDIMQHTGFDYAQVSTLLFNLSVSGIVEQEASGLWKQI